ncbi:MAG: HAMP domain-containing sensor histidine kinase [Thermoanaerobacteraceae bacterium]|nr:HAMP domain-containing sensor histidine kinase [Thermoanaerobacteraceae bacterium]
MKSIRNKLLISYLSVVLTVLIIFWLTQVVFIDRIYTRFMVDRLKNYGQQIISVLDTSGPDTSKLTAVIEESGAEVTAITRDNKIIFTTATMMGMMMRNILPYSGDTPKVFRYTHPHFETEYLAMSLPFDYNGIQANVILSIPATQISQNVELFKREFTYISLTSIIIAALVSLILSNGITRPIIKLKRAAREIAGGNVGIEIKPETADEIGDLASTMNEMSMKLSEIETLRQNLIANISHDLKTPLGVIKGYAEMIRDTDIDREKSYKYLAIISKEADRMSSMINDILALSQIQAGVTKPHMAVFNMKELISDVLDTFEGEIYERNLEVKFSIDDLNVYTDRELIRRVLVNIIGNAISSMEGSGLLSITSEIQDKEALFKISDTGMGIKEKDLEHIFDRYYKASDGGTGLGLAIVKEILTLHRSKYDINSTEGKGTTFTFTLPRS